MNSIPLLNRRRLVLAALLSAILVMSANELHADDKATPAVDPRWQKLYQADAQRWEMWLDEAQTRKAEIVAEPVFRWLNQTRANGQNGSVFLWLDQGRPVAIGGVFSYPRVNGGGRVLMHEFHALGPDRLFPKLSDSESKWQPSAGVSRLPLPDQPKVEEAAAKRSLQLRAIARDFVASSIDTKEQRWELRLLPKPLYRYDKPQGDVIDGALFAFVSDAGTDPELILICEALRTKIDTTWHYRAVRLSSSDLFLDYQANRVWTSLRNDPNGKLGNKDNTYLLLRERVIDDVPSPPMVEPKNR